MISIKVLLFGSRFVLLLMIPYTVSNLNPPEVDLPNDISSMKVNLLDNPPRNQRPSKTQTNSGSIIAPNYGDSCPYTSQDAKDVITAIDRIVNTFYQENYQKINMSSNGGVGLAVLRGQLNYILAKREDKLSHKVKQFMEQLHDLSAQLGLQIFDQFINASSDATEKYGAQVIKKSSNILQARSRDWLPNDTIIKHFTEFDNIIGDEKEVIHPHLNFHCLVTLLQDCSVPQACRKMYLTEIYSQDMLIHQVMYQQFAERRSCVAVNKEAFGNAQEYRDKLCSKAYLEAQVLEKNKFPTKYIDLFAKQVGFCGLMGYPNFMRADWLREILYWQQGSKSGCMNDFYGERKTTDAVITVKSVEGGEKTQESCLIHLTSVSLVALSVSLRHLVDVCSPNIFDGNLL